MTGPDLAQWQGIPAAIASDCLGRWQVLDAAVTHRAGTPMVGTAFPIRVMPGDNLTIHQALPAVPPGAVIVIDAGGFPDRAVWGEVLAVAARTRGAVGVVIDGATRDVKAQRALGFGCWSRSVSPAGPHKAGGGTWGELISCAGVPVAPGDVVLADEDGVVVVPQGRVDAVHAAAIARLEAEDRWKSRIRAGEPSLAVLGLPEDEGRSRT